MMPVRAYGLRAAALLGRDGRSGRGHGREAVAAVVHRRRADGADRLQEVAEVARDHRLLDGVADLAVLDVERVLGHTAEVELRVRYAARESAEDDAPLGRGHELVEGRVTRRHVEGRGARGHRAIELAGGVPVEEVV